VLILRGYGIRGVGLADKEGLTLPVLIVVLSDCRKREKKGKQRFTKTQKSAPDRSSRRGKKTTSADSVRHNDIFRGSKRTKLD